MVELPKTVAPGSRGVVGEMNMRFPVLKHG